MRDGDAIRTQPATLSVHRIGNDGKLSHVRTHDIETKGMTQWWSGFIAI